MCLFKVIVKIVRSTWKHKMAQHLFVKFSSNKFHLTLFILSPGGLCVRRDRLTVWLNRLITELRTRLIRESNNLVQEVISERNWKVCESTPLADSYSTYLDQEDCRFKCRVTDVNTAESCICPDKTLRLFDVFSQSLLKSIVFVWSLPRTPFSTHHFLIFLQFFIQCCTVSALCMSWLNKEINK